MTRRLTRVTSLLNKEVGQRYLIKERLGGGAHGGVYKAWDGVRKGDVAVKLYEENDDLDVQTAEAARHFEVAEGSAVLPLLEVHPEFAEGQVTVMPLMVGTLATDGPVFASRAVYVCRRILTALEFCHGRGVLHGDVKPSNAFIDRNEAVLLGDFGVAGGTLEYAAPEQIASGTRSVATDLWATAVTFYELLCGEAPFGERPAMEEEDIAERITSCTFVDPDERLPYLPLRFRTFFRECFVAAPEDRLYSSAATMRAALRELAVHVEWTRVSRSGALVCFEGHEIATDGHQTGVLYQATAVERVRAGDFVAQISKCPVDGAFRRLRGIEPFAGSKAQVGQKLSVWMRTLTEHGDIPR
jgi:serine/threonine protein kinase